MCAVPQAGRNLVFKLQGQTIQYSATYIKYRKRQKKNNTGFDYYFSHNIVTVLQRSSKRKKTYPYLITFVFRPEIDPFSIFPSSILYILLLLNRLFTKFCGP